MRNFYSLRASLDGSLLRTSKMRGVEYLVCPVISKLGNNVEWPVNAPTPELIPSNVLKFAIHSRNGRPFVMNHPRRDGEYVSANTPDTLEKYSFGFTTSAHYDEEVGGAKCEVWIDPLMAEAVGSDAVSIVKRLKNGETVEVSEGNYVIVREESGTFNGKPYGAIWELCINDHLAALPEGTVGACAVADGCGAGVLKGSEKGEDRQEERSMTLSLMASDIESRYSALTQARTPTYSGTETSKWSAPSFSDYVTNLHEGKENPTSVSQCSSSLKAKIAAHSLLGDPSASNIRDLTLFPCVNPSNGKLNENALRTVLGGRGDQAEITASALTSARDVATRLLNKEFGAEISTGEVNTTMKDRVSKTRSTFGRIVSSFMSSVKNSMLSSTLRYKLEDAIKEADPSFYWLEAWDEANGFVIYMTRIVKGDEWDGIVECHTYQRDFSLSSDGSVTLGGTITEVEFTGSWTPVGKEEAEEDSSETGGDSGMEMEIGEDGSTKSTCSCKGKAKANINTTKTPTEEMTMANAEKKKEVVTKLISSGAYKGIDEKTLNSLSEEALTSMLEVAEKAEKEGKEVKEAKVDNGKVTVILSEKKVEEKVSEELTEDQWMSKAPPHIRAMATRYQEAEQAHRLSLVASLKTVATGFSEEDLTSMETPILEKLAASFKIDNSSIQLDYSGKGFPATAPITASSSEPMRELPDTWGLNSKAQSN